MKSACLAHPQAILEIASRPPMHFACFSMPAPPRPPLSEWPQLDSIMGTDKKAPPGTSPSGIKSKSANVEGETKDPPPPPPPLPRPRVTSGGKPGVTSGEWPGVTPGGARPAGSSTDKLNDTPDKDPPPPPPPLPKPRVTSGGKQGATSSAWPGVTPGGSRPAGSSTDTCDDNPKKAEGAPPASSRPKRPCPVNPDVTSKPDKPTFRVPSAPVKAAKKDQMAATRTSTPPSPKQKPTQNSGFAHSLRKDAPSSQQKSKKSSKRQKAVFQGSSPRLRVTLAP